jgi:hypothetical protein
MNKFYKRVLRIFIVLIVLLIISGGSAYAIFEKINPDFEDISAKEMHKVLKENREYAISQAKDKGEYKCCIYPDCTMCYDSANKWNYDQAGKCFCDEFIARGEEPCPQCKKGLECVSGTKHGTEKDAFCDFDLNQAG